MKIVAQRVSSSSVSTGGSVIGEIERGLCVFVGIGPNDTEREVSWMAEKIVNLRIFGDEGGKMNLSLLDVGGEVLAISQFTLYADCRKGRRPSFADAAPPELGNELYSRFVESLRKLGVKVATGLFGAEMKVDISNEGPVTIILDSVDMPVK